ncbi:hypothetical protein OF83DRAFT_1137173 [Amylostereum chailletii]|nr:hypothetical protein OF83DRAFT_1137173 [Amylostereum chailletii]
MPRPSSNVDESVGFVERSNFQRLRQLGLYANANPQPQLTLNRDILVLITDLLDRTSLLIFVQACKLFHDIGLDHLLRRPIHLFNMDNTVSFLTFLRGDPVQRGVRVRDLRLDDVLRYPPIEMTRIWTTKLVGIWTKLVGTTKLVGILVLCPNVQHLQLSSGDTYLHLGKHIHRAISSLEFLHTLDLKGVIPEALDILSQQRSPIVNIRIALRGCAPRLPKDVMLPLVSFQATLRSLDISGGDLNVELVDGARYPHVLSLRFSMPSHASRSLKHYVRCFPSLRTLIISSIIGHIFPVRAIESYHRENKQFLENSDQGWKLKSVGGEASDLYALALSGSVDQLHIIVGPCTVHYLPFVVRSLRATQLDIKFFPYVPMLDLASRLFPQSHPLPVTHLTIRVAFRRVPSQDLEELGVSTSSLPS